MFFDYFYKTLSKHNSWKQWPSWNEYMWQAQLKNFLVSEICFSRKIEEHPTSTSRQPLNWIARKKQRVWNSNIAPLIRLYNPISSISQVKEDCTISKMDVY